MKKNVIKFGLLGSILILTIASCSKNDSDSETKTETETGVLSNDWMKLTYGESALNSNVSLTNSKINFDLLVADNTPTQVLNAIKSGSEFQTPDLTNAIVLTGSNSISIDVAGKTYYVPEGQTFTGNINFNQQAKIYVLGTWSGSAGPVPARGQVVVGTHGRLDATNFSLNTDSSVLDNYGTVVYSTSNVNGILNNYKTITFRNALTINGSAVVSNYCKATFENYTIINKVLNNYGQVDLKNGLQINGSGLLNLFQGSLAQISGGALNYDGKIVNNQNGFARFNVLTGAQVGNVTNGSAEISGKIDLNFAEGINYSVYSGSQPRAKLLNGATLNANTFISGNECIQQQGKPACDDTQLSFVWVAKVKSPVIDATTLSATEVQIKDSKAYVSYHTNDEAFGDTSNGALRVFNVQDQSLPILISEAEFTNAEFNGLNVEGNKLNAVGGNKAGGLVFETTLVDGNFNTTSLDSFKRFKFEGVAGKNAYMYNSILWVVSGGANGGYFKLNPNDSYKVTDKMYTGGAKAKYVAHNATNQAFLAVEPNGAFLRIASIDGANPKEFHYPSLVQRVQTGKNVITMDDNFVYLALSDQGVAKINIQTGELVAHFVPNNFLKPDGTKVFKNNGLTNGVAVNECYLYLANGADGVIVLNKNSFNVVGSFGLKESANYVYAKNGLLFVATGRDGLNIIKIN